MISAIGNYFISNYGLIPLDEIDFHIQDNDDIIYEVIRFVDEKPLFLEDHFMRFLKSFNFTTEEIEKQKKLFTNSIKTLIEKNNRKEGNIRYQFNNNDTHLFCAWMVPHRYPTRRQYKLGVAVKSYLAERHEPNIKTRDIKLRDGADQFIKESNIYEAILINTMGQVTEGSRSNIFFIKNNLFVTPPIAMALPGITRQKIIKLLRQHGFIYNERPIYTSEIQNFDSCFISGTSPKILPVARMDHVQMDVNHSLLLEITGLYNQEIDTYMAQFSWE